VLLVSSRIYDVSRTLRSNVLSVRERDIFNINLRPCLIVIHFQPQVLLTYSRS
jgi:hypothetical protein